MVRSTFAAELLSGGDAVDQGLLLSQLMHELDQGSTIAVEARNLRLTGGYKIPQVLFLDAMSVFAAVTVVFVKAPAEKSLLCHVKFLRELLDHGVLAAIGWLDTRDLVRRSHKRRCAAGRFAEFVRWLLHSEARTKDLAT